MHFYRGQPVQRLSYVFLGQSGGFLQRLAQSEPANHVRGGDGRSAAERLEPQVLDPVVFNLQVNREKVPAHRVSRGAHAVRVLQLARIPRVLKVFNHFFRILQTHLLTPVKVRYADAFSAFNELIFLKAAIVFGRTETT